VKSRKADALQFFSLQVKTTTDPRSRHLRCIVLVVEGEKWSATKWISVRSFDNHPNVRIERTGHVPMTIWFCLTLLFCHNSFEVWDDWKRTRTKLGLYVGAPVSVLLLLRCTSENQVCSQQIGYSFFLNCNLISENLWYKEKDMIPSASQPLRCPRRRTN
jgi:hypothetical protein